MRRLLEVLARLAPWLLILAVGLATFQGTLAHGFVYDDHWTILENPAVVRSDGLDLVAAGSASRVGGEHAEHLEVDLRWRPLMVVSNWIDYRLAGPAPLLHHAHSLALYLISALLVHAFGRSLGLSKRIALVGALVFVAHPLHVEVVSAINYREDLLVTSLGLGAFLLLSPRSKDRRERLAPALLGAVCLALAINAKATAVVVPVLLVVRDGLFARAEWRATLRRRLPVHALAFAALFSSRQVLDLFTGHRPVGYRGTGAPSGAVDSILTQLAIWCEYIRQTVLPTALSPDYAPINELPSFHFKAALGAALVVGLVAFCLKMRATHPKLVFLVAWFALGLLPTSILLAGPTPRADRHVFFASVASAILVAYAIDALVRRLGRDRRVAVVASAVIVGMCALVSARETKKWRDDASLWKSAASDPSSSVRAHVAWMGTELEAGRIERALSIGEKAAKRWPENWQLHEQIGHARLTLGSPRLAVEHYELALRYGGARDPNLLSKLAHALFEAGDVARSVRTYEEAIALAPRLARLHRNLGRVLALSGRLPEAEQALRRAHDLEPSEETSRWLGQVLAELR